jgi:hypothetical protein
MMIERDRVVELIDGEAVLARPGMSGLNPRLPAAKTRRS